MSFIVGVLAGKLVNYYIMAIAALVFILLVTLWWNDKRFMTIGFLGLTLLAGAMRLQTSFPYDEGNFIGKYYNQKLEIEGLVSKDPDVRSNKTNLTIKPIRVVSTSPASGILPTPGEGEKLMGNILVSIGKYPEYQYGDRLKLSGKLEKPFETEEFSYSNYLARFDTYALMRFPKIQKLAGNSGYQVIAILLKLKHKFIEVLSQILPEPHSALALGLILGLKKSLPEALRQALVIAGVSHIVVISGYNISIITRNLLKTRTLWGRKIAFLLSLATVVGFVILTGAEASVIRAGLMGMMLVAALSLGRIYQSVNALILVATAMIVQNPKILQFDVGFQLSFLATLGLIYLSPIFEKWFKALPDILGMRTNLSSTLAAQIFTLPLLVWHFDRLSLIAPLVNILILWIIPYTMFFVFIVGILGIIYLPFGKLFLGIPWIFLEYQVRLVEFFARVPFAAISFKLPIAALVIYYLLLIFVMALYRHQKKFYYYLEYARQKI